MDRINSDNFNINLPNSALNSNSNNNIAQLSIDPLGVNPLTSLNFHVQTEVLDLDTVDEVSLEDKVTEKNINAMIKLINDDYDEQKKNYEEIKKYGETEKNNLDNKFNNLLNPNQSTNQEVPEQEAGTSKEIKEKITTIETETGENYKDLNDFFTKYNESKKQDQVNDNMIAPGESGTDIYQNKVSAMTKFVKENFGFDKVEDFEKYYNEINNTISSTKQAIDFIEHCKQTTKYDLTTKLDDYQNYEAPKINKEDFSYDQTGTDGTNQITYNGNGCPLDALKVFKENYQGNLNGIDSKIYDLYEASQANPELGKLYSYIYNTKGKEAAAEYLEIMEDDINKIEGQKHAAEFLNSLNKKDNADTLDAISNHLKVSGKGLVDGVDSYFDGLAAWLSTSNQRTADDYEKMYIIQALMSQSDKENAGLITLAEGKYKNNSQTPGVIEKYQIDYTEDYAGKFLGDNYQISQSIGNMLPSILMSTVSPVAGTVSMGVSAGGNSYHQALVEGYSVGKSLFYGVVSGASEALLEKFMGGIPGLSDVNVTSFKTFAQAVVKEGIEEGSQEYIDALARAGIFKEGIDLSETTKNAIKSGIYGMITAGIMNSGSLATNSIKNIKNNKPNTSIDVNTNNNADKLNLKDLKYDTYKATSNALAYLESNLKKYVYKDTSSIPGLNQQIKDNGLYHFTDESSADAIMSSNYIKSSGVISSYGTKKTFFFNGIPEVGAIASNLDKIPLKTTAVKVDATENIIDSKKLKVRSLDDQAISYDGNFDLSNTNTTKEYFVLEKVDDELKYKKVSKEEYDSYQNTPEGQQLQEFLNNKSNVNAIKYDFLQNLQNKNISGSTNIINNNYKQKFFDQLLFDKNSELGDNSAVVNKLYNTFCEVYESGDKISKNIISAFLKTKETIQIFPSDTQSAYLEAFGALQLEPGIDNNALLHEIGHYYYHQLLGEQIPEHFDSVIANAKKHALGQKNIDFVFNGKEFENARYLNLLEEICSSENKSNADLGVMSDILSGIHLGAPLTGPNGPLVLPYGHSSQYYTKRNMEVKLENINYNKVFDEQFANFFSLYMNNKTEQIEVLRKFLGDDWYNSMMDTLMKINDISTNINTNTNANLNINNNSFSNSISVNSNNNNTNYNSTTILDNAINIINNKYGIGVGFVQLREYLLTNNSSFLTRDGNVRNIVTKLDKKDIFNYLDKIVLDYDKGVIGNDVITTYQVNELRQYIEGLREYYPDNKIDKAKTIFNKLENHFEQYNFNNKNFGADQGVAKQQITYTANMKYVTQYYDSVKKSFMRKYNMSNSDASRLVTGFDNTGACSYAATANEIFASYKDRPADFMQDFGYPMYTMVDGKQTLNSLELLTDLYLFENHTDNGGRLFTTTADGRTITTALGLSSQLDLFNRNILSTEEQMYMSFGGMGKSVYLIDKFLKSKNSSLSYKSEVVIDSFDTKKVLSDSDIENIKENVSEKVINGYQIELDFFSHQNPIYMKNLSGGMDCSTSTWNEGGGHAVFVTNMTDEGFIVSSWGEKYLISFSDLKTGSFTLNASKINK